VGIIRAVENHPSADRLYVVTVDVGESRTRTIVAGIRPQYPPEALLDRTIAVLVNLEPRTIRKITSQGMLLAAEDGGRVVLLAPPEGARPGATLLAGGVGSGTIAYARFEGQPILVGRVVGAAEGGSSRVDVGGREVVVAMACAPGAFLLVRLDSVTAERGEVLADRGSGLVTTAVELPPGTRVR
jgi:tRNA-binding EMAP/Myf-like protein